MFSNRFFSVFITLWIFVYLNSWAQQGNMTLFGVIEDEKGNPIPAVFLEIKNNSTNKTYHTITDISGEFHIILPVMDSLSIKTQHIGYEKKSMKIVPSHPFLQEVKMELKNKIKFLNSIEIESTHLKESMMKAVKAKSIKNVPVPFGDFSQALASGAFLGISSNNELSSSYNVRGGNYDENSIYVNGIQIYRPLLVKYGQQEGMSFINPDLVKSVSFSSGGWSSKYGDKMSSILEVDYKTPKELSISGEISLLNAKLHIGSQSKDKKIQGIMGFRYKSSKYLLNTLETKGEYFPTFIDLQTLIKYNFVSKEKKKSFIDFLFSFAQNDYLVEPQQRETLFGTLNQTKKIEVGFDGTDQLKYKTFQTGLRWSFKTEKSESSVIASFINTKEREYTNLEYGYRLCDVISNNQNECLTIRGLGTEYENARNLLNISIYSLETHQKTQLKKNKYISWGAAFKFFDIEDVLNRYVFKDFADVVETFDKTYQNHRLYYQRYTAYLQWEYNWNGNQLIYGARFLFQTLNRQWHINPRIQYQWGFKGLPAWTFHVATGLYVQPNFYREMRDFQGNLNTQISNQQALHFILGTDYLFDMWDRPFVLDMEAYYKHLFALIPFDVDNLNIRYFGDNLSQGYTTGIDVRLSGEFIEGTSSWITMNVMTTRENLVNDNKGYIRRPTDQVVNLSLFLQDHLPNYPSFQVQLRLLYGSGLPFSPPNAIEYRNALSGGTSYFRVDSGFSKLFLLKRCEIVVALEVLNLFGVANTISFLWIEDVNQTQYAIPNRLSQRYLNLKISATWN